MTPHEEVKWLKNAMSNLIPFVNAVKSNSEKEIASLKRKISILEQRCGDVADNCDGDSVHYKKREKPPSMYANEEEAKLLFSLSQSHSPRLVK
tara:strand:- start:129 stop:407 length:279 start_codon:yes stop_codon:yes gene_type:complete